jgi:hemoglobin
MRRLHCLAFLSLAAFLGLLSEGGRAQDNSTGPLDRKTVDTMVFNSLRDVINRGADLYNSGDWAGCYRLYEGALRIVKPLLGHRSEMQKAIGDGLTEAEADAVLYRRAFVLRKVIDKVRSDIHPTSKASSKPDDSVVEKKPGDKKGDAPKTAWDRLGGEKGVGKVVDDLIATVAKDKTVDFSRRGKYTLQPIDIELLRKSLISQISELTGGPLKYDGLSMREAHAGMRITDAEFDAFMVDVEKVLKDHNVDSADAAKIVAAYKGYRKDIVLQAKPPDKKADDKKADDKKADDKKADDKKRLEKDSKEKQPGTESKEKPPQASAGVSGTVTWKGAPLAEGTIHFDGLIYGQIKNYSAKIKADGTYEANGLKEGEYRVWIRAPLIAKQYTAPKTTSLVLQFTGDRKVADFALTD